jgi:hypothetical protein
MRSEDIFLFVFGIFVTAICIGPYIALALFESEQEGKDNG